MLANDFRHEKVQPFVFAMTADDYSFFDRFPMPTEVVVLKNDISLVGQMFRSYLLAEFAKLKRLAPLFRSAGICTIVWEFKLCPKS